MASHLTTRRLRLAGAALLFVVLPACEDGPTEPGVFAHPVDGQLWAAVVVPHGTPDLRTWTPFLASSRGEAETTLRQVRTLRGEADRLRRSGEVTAAAQAEEEATLLVARSIAQAPPPPVLLSALAALDTWSERASTAADQAGSAELAASLDAVRGHRTAAAEALQAADTAAAVLQIAQASAVVRQQAPEAVAMRALAHAEEQLTRNPSPDEDAVRALRLIRTSREALVAGDAPRALRRALYALQLLHGDAVEERVLPAATQ